MYLKTSFYEDLLGKLNKLPCHVVTFRIRAAMPACFVAGAREIIGQQRAEIVDGSVYQMAIHDWNTVGCF